MKTDKRKEHARAWCESNGRACNFGHLKCDKTCKKRREISQKILKGEL